MDFATFHVQLLSGPRGLFLLQAFQSIYLPVLQNFSNCIPVIIMLSHFMIASCLHLNKIFPLLVISRAAISAQPCTTDVFVRDSSQEGWHLFSCSFLNHISVFWVSVTSEKVLFTAWEQRWLLEQSCSNLRFYFKGQLSVTLLNPAGVSLYLKTRSQISCIKRFEATLNTDTVKHLRAT